jgi:hypothetical protein
LHELLLLSDSPGTPAISLYVFTVSSPRFIRVNTREFNGNPYSLYSRVAKNQTAVPLAKLHIGYDKKQKRGSIPV